MTKHYLFLFTLLIAHSSLSVTQQYTPDANTVALWHMNEISGSNVADTSGNGNDGTATGTIPNVRMGMRFDFYSDTSYYIIVSKVFF